MLKLRIIGAAALVLGLAQPAFAEEDPFLWLEEIESPRVMAWIAERNAETMGSIGRDPRFEEAKAEALAIIAATDRIPAPTFLGGKIANFWQDETHIRGIWRQATLKSYRSATPKWETLLDIDALAAAEGKAYAFSGADCLAPRDERCLIALSDGGKDATFIREFSVSKKAFLPGGFTLPEGKQWVTWLDEETLLAAVALTPAEETQSGYPRVLRLWKRGTALSDAPVIYEGETGDLTVFPGVIGDYRNRHALIVRSLSFFEQEHFIRMRDGSLVPLEVPKDAEIEGHFGGQVILSLRSDWAVNGATYPQGAFVSFSFDQFLRTRTIADVRLLHAPTEKQAIQGVAIAEDALYVSLLDNVAGQVIGYRLSRGAWAGKPVPIEGKGAVTIAAASATSPRLLLTFEDFLSPDRLLLIRERGAKPEPVKSLPPRFNAEGLEALQFEAASPDGTRVPYFLVRKAGAEGAMPTILYGYGGFEIPMTPYYSGTLGKLWLEKGGAYALANIRGGGEFGPAWHQAAQKEKRQKAHEDFIAVARDLIDRGLTNKGKLGIMGGSQGGLLVGAAMTQAPELFGAALIQNPLLDMKRYHRLLAGASWMSEYGNPDDPADWAAIGAYSPYQKLDPKADYPVPFLTTSTRDDRVHPAHARKFAAKMMAQGHGVSYFEETEGGHAAGTNLPQIAARSALEFLYFRRALMGGGTGAEATVPQN